jgi:hypothetical protein
MYLMRSNDLIKYKLIIIIGGWYVDIILTSVLNIVDRLKLMRQCFENWVCFRFQVKVGGREGGGVEGRTVVWWDR